MMVRVRGLLVMFTRPLMLVILMGYVLMAAGIMFQNQIKKDTNICFGHTVVPHIISTCNFPVVRILSPEPTTRAF